MSQYKTNIQIGDVEDVPVVVEYDAVPECRGSRGRYGEQLEPDIQAHIEVNSVNLVEDGREITLTTRQEERMEEEIAEWLGGMYDQDPPEGYEE